MNSLTLDWNSIRPLNGGRDKGFEELCAQLARAESPPGSQFVRKGTPDAGVECYAVLRDGCEWGWQSKYFDTLGDSQWAQIDKSVRTAIKKHSRLTKYFVCVPLDRPDGRIEGRMSAKERWDEHEKSWSKLASDAGIAIEFIYWGSHELLELLARSEHVGRLRFWFDVRGFDPAWFSARLDEALKTAGPRYTPEIHVDLPIAEEFEAFGRTTRFIDGVKAHARRIRDKLGNLAQSDRDNPDTEVDAVAANVSAKLGILLGALSSLDAQPTGALPFKRMASDAIAAEASVNDLVKLLADREADVDAKSRAKNAKRYSFHSNPLRDRRVRLERLAAQIHSAYRHLDHIEKMANNDLMILRGAAGTGKTHLLCDIARQRLAAGQPTVLLMGQRFVGSEVPWTQAMQQLDLVGLSAEEFVGALESAAQAAGSRALLFVDAINEGEGRKIWPSHLAAFVAHLERSAWVSVVLSVRSSYENSVIAADIRDRAVGLTHRGFAEHEYDATKTFFIHYGLELPSTPLLAPEFRNPLFLKTLCLGLIAIGERRLPRGSHSITTVFDTYLSAVNRRLAALFDFDPRSPLVTQALQKVSYEFSDKGRRWLTLKEAKDIVDSLLPGRDFERSLYRGMVVEGVLVEDVSSKSADELVYVAYERFADHLVAKALLDKHLDESNPALAFAPTGPLAFICDEKDYVPPGLIEALCIQIPERIGRELTDIAPSCVNRWDLRPAFRQSLIWRAYEAFTANTQRTLRSLCQDENDQHETLDVLLTVAMLPGHPLGARFLDRWLRKSKMPDRDAWWSVFLYQTWGSHGAVDRMIDWACSLAPTATVDDDSIDLCAISLSWMLTTSHRYLRDRATKALVSLLSGRLAATARLVKHFSDVDDPYVAERIYAVAYGVAMRSHDPAAVGALAINVYDEVFADGSPTPHILLRDYARGVIERAIYLGFVLDVAVERARPPYKSQWPEIPTEDDVKSLLPNWSDASSYESGSLEWARHSIGTSVTDGDFARYVIGTNSSSTDWLSLRLDEAPWTPSPPIEEQLRALVSEFSEDELRSWTEFEIADHAFEDASGGFLGRLFSRLGKGSTSSDSQESVDEIDPKVVELAQKREEALGSLQRVCTEEHIRRLTTLLAKKENGRTEHPPRFDLGQIQRYILWRVFDLGWTAERFGYFDRYNVRSDGRSASKPERIGKKYQWIAYHEILAFVSDRFQYREQFREDEGDQAYDGPWQDSLRDIDPSCTLRSLPGGNSWVPHARSWWAPERYESWGEADRPKEWVLQREDLPRMENLLAVTDPADGARWLNCQGFLSWKQHVPVELDPTEVERRELWLIVNGYLIQSDDVPAFLKWAEAVDFMGRWMPDPPTEYRMFLGEHGWSPASRYFEKPYYGDDGWTRPDKDCPVKVRCIAREYLREASGFDCSIDETYTLRLPAADLARSVGMRWSGDGASFEAADGTVTAQDPTAYSDGPAALLLREDSMTEYLAREKLSICWTVIGEKRILQPSYGERPHHPVLRLSGAYALVGKGITGFAKHILDDLDGDNSGGRQVLGIVRSVSGQ
jgi:hypothetical protein